jgi:hypothetical protein
MTRRDSPSDPLLWLRESKEMSPPEGAEARVAARLAALAAPAGLLAPPSGSEPSAAAPPSGHMKMLAERFVRWSLLPLGLGLGAGIYAARGGEQLHPQPVLPGLSVPSALSVASASRESEPPESTLDAVAPPAAATASAPAKSTLTAERDLLDRARRQLASEEPARALGFLEQHARRFPHGQLSEEREAMWVNVLALLGRGGEAKARGQAFGERFPHSLMGSSVRAAVRAADEPK